MACRKSADAHRPFQGDVWSLANQLARRSCRPNDAVPDAYRPVSPDFGNLPSSHSGVHYQGHAQKAGHKPAQKPYSSRQFQRNVRDCEHAGCNLMARSNKAGGQDHAGNAHARPEHHNQHYAKCLRLQDHHENQCQFPQESFRHYFQ